MILNTNRGAVVLLGLCAQVVLTMLFLWRFEPSVENRLVADGHQALRSASISWARLSANGRDLEISGLAPDRELKQRAIELVEDIKGVRNVTDNLLVASVVHVPKDTEELRQRAAAALADIEDTAPIFAVDLPYEIHMQVAAGTLTLSGLVPDDIAKESLLNLANREFGAGRLINRLITSPGAPDDYLAAATHAISVANQLSSGLVGVRQAQVFVQGVLRPNTNADDITEYLYTNLPEGFEVSVQAGDQADLAQLMRTFPDFAARIGTIEGLSRDDTTIETVRTPPPPDNRVSTPTTTQDIAANDCARKIDKVLASRAIGFDTGSSDITTQSLDLVSELVTIAKMCPQTSVQIAGHTDDQGTDENNLRLSQERAEAVMEYLVKNGVSLSRLSAVGYGETQPLVENTSADNRKINRRIEFRISDENQQ